MDGIAGTAQVHGSTPHGTDAQSAAGARLGTFDNRGVSARAGNTQTPPVRGTPAAVASVTTPREAASFMRSGVVLADTPMPGSPRSLAAPSGQASTGQEEVRSPAKGRRKYPDKPSPEEIAALRAAKAAGKAVRAQKSKPKGKQDGTDGKEPALQFGKLAVDPGSTLRAVVDWKFRQLDPVTGDASCEMRVPFILDALKILAESNFALRNLAPGFNAQYGPEFSELPADIGSKKRSLPRSGSMPEHYFSLLYPLSVIRQRAVDSLRFLIDDEPDGSTYSCSEVSRWKSAAAQYSVDYIRKTARAQAAETGDRAPVMRQISRMLDEVNIELTKGGYRQPILPVFTAEYFLTQHEHLRGRPLVLVLTRWGYDKAGEQHHYGTHVYAYRPNRADALKDRKFEPDRVAPGVAEARKGVTVVHAFNMFPLDPAERKEYEEATGFMSEETFFNSPDNAEFESGFLACDVSHLLRMWGAAHPPAPASALAQGMGQGRARDYIEAKHQAKRSASAVREYRLNSPVALFGTSETNLSDEYFAYKKMSDRYRVTGIRYASEPTANQKSYYAGPPGCVGHDAPRDEWTAMSAADFSDIASAGGAKALRDRVTYVPKSYRRACQPVPFAGVHCFVSSFDSEQMHADRLNAEFPPHRKFSRELRLELIAGTLFKSPGKKRGIPEKRELAFWTVEETIDGKRKTSVHYPDSKTEMGNAAKLTPEDREALADRLTKIARANRAYEERQSSSMPAGVQ